MFIDGKITQIIKCNDLKKYLLGLGEIPKNKDMIYVVSCKIYDMSLLLRLIYRIFNPNFLKKNRWTVFLPRGKIKERGYAEGAYIQLEVKRAYVPTDYYLGD